MIFELNLWLKNWLRYRLNSKLDIFCIHPLNWKIDQCPDLFPLLMIDILIKSIYIQRWIFFYTFDFLPQPYYLVLVHPIFQNFKKNQVFMSERGILESGCKIDKQLSCHFAPFSEKQFFSRPYILKITQPQTLKKPKNSLIW